MRVIVDTNVWSVALRRPRHRLSAPQRTVREKLAELVEEDRVVMLGIIRQEVLSGIRDQDTFLRIRDTLRAFQDEPLHAADFEEAAAISNRLRTAGIASCSVDNLLCAVALRGNHALMTADKDFLRYAKVLPLTLHMA